MGELGLNFEPTGLREQLVQHEYLFLALLGGFNPKYADIYTEPVQAVYEGGFPEPC